MGGRMLANVVGRALFLLVLFLAPALSGCFDANDEPGPRLAQPTNELPPIPSSGTAPTVSRNSVPLNYSDPGYVMDAAWTVGDAWYYESLGTPTWYQAFRVVDKKTSEERVAYTVELAIGIAGNAPKSRSTLTINGTSWARERTTDTLGSVVTYAPPAEDLRFTRNGSFGFNVTGVDGRGVTWGEVHRANSRYVGLEEVRLAWGGTTFAGRVEHRELVTDGEGDHRVLTTRWYDRRFLNWVYAEIEADSTTTTYVLVGARVAGQVYGDLREY